MGIIIQDLKVLNILLKILKVKIHICQILYLMPKSLIKYIKKILKIMILKIKKKIIFHVLKYYYIFYNLLFIILKVIQFMLIAL